MESIALKILSRFQAYERFRKMNSPRGTDWSKKKEVELERQLSDELGPTFKVLRMMTLVDSPGFGLEEALLACIREKLSSPPHVD